MIKIFIFLILIIIFNIPKKFESTICNKQLTDTE